MFDSIPEELKEQIRQEGSLEKLVSALFSLAQDLSDADQVGGKTDESDIDELKSGVLVPVSARDTGV